MQLFGAGGHVTALLRAMRPWGWKNLIADKHSDDRERDLINHVLVTVGERLAIAKQLSAAQLRDDKFNQQRFADMADQLELAYKTIQQLSDMVETLTAELPPAEVIRALRSRGDKMNTVSVDLHGKVHTFLVPSLGTENPADWVRWWLRFTERYGDA